MADRLTQLQDCLDDLLTQMYAALSYIQTRHPYGNLPGQPSQAPPPQSTPQQPNGQQQQQQQAARTTGSSAQQAENDRERTPTPPPEETQAFDAALRELARDLVLKEQQVEYLINSLPGIGSSEADQERRMRELEGELREVEAERARAEEEREKLVEGLGRVMVGVKRVG